VCVEESAEVGRKVTGEIEEWEKCEWVGGGQEREGEVREGSV
jgi:hypothetical protein